MSPSPHLMILTRFILQGVQQERTVEGDKKKKESKRNMKELEEDREKMEYDEGGKD